MDCPGSDMEKKDLRSHKMVQEWRKLPHSPLVLDRTPFWMRVWMRLWEGAQLIVLPNSEKRGLQSWNFRFLSGHMWVNCLSVQICKMATPASQRSAPLDSFYSKMEMPLGSLHEREIGTEGHVHDVGSLSLPCRSWGGGNVLRSQCYSLCKTDSGVPHGWQTKG